MPATTGTAEMWQARISHDLAAALRDDAELLGLDGRTEIIRAALGPCTGMPPRSACRAALTRSTATRRRRCRSASDRLATTQTPMSLPEPFRGEVWDVDLEDVGRHPAVVLSANLRNARLGHVAVASITGTAGPDQTHVPLDGQAGLTRYDKSYADVTALQPVARSRLVQRRGLLATAELEHLARQVEVYLGLAGA